MRSRRSESVRIRQALVSSEELGEFAAAPGPRDSHLIVTEHDSGAPIGVVSTLDIARALAGFPERHPAP